MDGRNNPSSPAIHKKSPCSGAFFMNGWGRSGGSLRFKKLPGAIFIRYIHVAHPSGHQVIQCVHVIQSILVNSLWLARRAEYMDVF